MYHHYLVNVVDSIDGDLRSVTTTCNECGSVWVHGSDNPQIDTMVTIAYHAGKTGHDDFQVDVETEPVSTVDCTITVGLDDE